MREYLCCNLQQTGRLMFFRGNGYKNVWFLLLALCNTVLEGKELISRRNEINDNTVHYLVMLCSRRQKWSTIKTALQTIIRVTVNAILISFHGFELASQRSTATGTILCWTLILVLYQMIEKALKSFPERKDTG